MKNNRIKHKNPTAPKSPSYLRAMIPYCIVLGIITILLGCQQIQQPSPERPEWAEQSTVTHHSIRFISAIGTGDTALTGEELLGEAEDAARTGLAKELNRYCRKTLREFITSATEPDAELTPVHKEFINTVSSSATNAILRRTTRHDTWAEEDNQVVTVLYRVPVGKVHDAIQMEAERVIKNVPPLGDAPHDDTIQNLKNFLDTKLTERLKGKGEQQEELEVSDEGEEIPDWLSKGPSREFPPKQYLLATGLGQNQTAAEENAKKQIYKQIQNRVDAVISELARTDNSIARNLRDLSRKSLQIKASQITDIQVRKHWYDTVTGTYYILALLDREKLIDQYLQIVRNKARECNQAYETAKNQNRADNIRSALTDYLVAIRSLKAKLRAQLLIYALSPDQKQPIDIPETTDSSELKQNLRSLLSDITLKKTAGDEQWVSPDQNTPEPLKVQCKWQKSAKPVPRIPIEFRIRDGSGKLSYDRATDAEGLAQCTIADFTADSQGLLTIRSDVNLRALTDGAPLPDVQPPATLFHIIRRSRRDATCAFVIEGPASTEKLYQSIRDTLQDAKYHVLPRKDVQSALRRVDKTLTVSSLSQIADTLSTDRAPLIFWIKSESKIVEQRKTSEGMLYFSHMPVTIEVFDPKLPAATILHTFSITGKGAYAGDKKEAHARARERVAKLIGSATLKWLNAKFQ